MTEAIVYPHFSLRYPSVGILVDVSKAGVREIIFLFLKIYPMLTPACCYRLRCGCHCWLAHV